jgi:hypothetical protein
MPSAIKQLLLGRPLHIEEFLQVPPTPCEPSGHLHGTPDG